MAQYDLSDLTSQERMLLEKRPSALTEEEKRLRRKLQNRLSAQGSRHRKRQYATSLEQSTDMLRHKIKETTTENFVLKQRIAYFMNQNQELIKLLQCNAIPIPSSLESSPPPINGFDRTAKRPLPYYDADASSSEFDSHSHGSLETRRSSRRRTVRKESDDDTYSYLLHPHGHQEDEDDTTSTDSFDHYSSSTIIDEDSYTDGVMRTTRRSTRRQTVEPKHQEDVPSPQSSSSSSSVNSRPSPATSVQSFSLHLQHQTNDRAYPLVPSDTNPSPSCSSGGDVNSPSPLKPTPLFSIPTTTATTSYPRGGLAAMNGSTSLPLQTASGQIPSLLSTTNALASNGSVIPTPINHIKTTDLRPAQGMRAPLAPTSVIYKPVVGSTTLTSNSSYTQQPLRGQSFPQRVTPSAFKFPFQTHMQQQQQQQQQSQQQIVFVPIFCPADGSSPTMVQLGGHAALAPVKQYSTPF